MDFVLFGSGAALTALLGYWTLVVLERLVLRGSAEARRVREDSGLARLLRQVMHSLSGACTRQQALLHSPRGNDANEAFYRRLFP